MYILNGLNTPGKLTGCSLFSSMLYDSLTVTPVQIDTFDSHCGHFHKTIFLSKIVKIHSFIIMIIHFIKELVPASLMVR